MSDIDEFWRLREPIESALKYSAGTHTIEDVAQGVSDGRFQIWNHHNSAVITEIIVYPQVKVLHYFLAGGNLDELKSMRPVIESWAKQLGCVRVTLAGRKGWEKTFLKDEGYEPKWFMLSKEL